MQTQALPYKYPSFFFIHSPSASILEEKSEGEETKKTLEQSRVWETNKRREKGIGGE